MGEMRLPVAFVFTTLRVTTTVTGKRFILLASSSYDNDTTFKAIIALNTLAGNLSIALACVRKVNLDRNVSLW